MGSFVDGMIVGMILVIVLLYSFSIVLSLREKRHKDRPWCERRSRKIYLDLPGPDMSEEDAKHFTKHVRFSSLPGQRNGAIKNYMMGKHDVDEMERKLDERLGFGDRGWEWRRGKTIAEHEAQCRPRLEMR